MSEEEHSHLNYVLRVKNDIDLDSVAASCP